MRIIYSCLLIAIALTGTQQCVAQYGTFGEDTCPEDSAAVDDIIYYGELLDMSGGYLTGDTVFDFTVYDFDGNPLNLYTELSGEKPVVLINGSVSCLRFRGTFEPDNNGQQYVAARNYLEEHINDYNWIFIYGVEAHPTDGNCPSNCPPTVSNDTTVVQPPFYVDRRWAVRGWEDSPEHDFPFTMYADNPNNAVYNNFFQRPFGLVAINCDGTVALRGDWVNSFFMDATNVTALNEWRLESDACTIDWTPDDGTDEDDDTDDDGTDDDGTTTTARTTTARTTTARTTTARTTTARTTTARTTTARTMTARTMTARTTTARTTTARTTTARTTTIRRLMTDHHWLSQAEIRTTRLFPTASSKLPPT